MGFPVEEIRIVEAEQTLGLVFRPELRARLMRNNGGEIEADGVPWTLHPVWDSSDRKRAARSANHIVNETRLAKEWPGFPPDAVAIANEGGDYLMIRPGRATVKLSLHETGEVQDVEVTWDL
jgi:hypothetical protein